MNAIETKGLTEKFGSVTAVDSLNLTVRDGELYALLGVNGAGKTTTIRMLCGLIAPTSGDALILGDSVVSNPHVAKAKLNLSPQETAVARNLTVRENLMMTAGLYSMEHAEAKARADEMIESLRLREVERRFAKTLSGGMQRRLSIAMALITRPKVLFLDEPTLGLDVIMRRELWASIEKLKGKIAIVLTTHYMEEAEALSDRIGVMAHGRMCAEGTAAELVARTGVKTLEDAFIKLASVEVEVA